MSNVEEIDISFFAHNFIIFYNFSKIPGSVKNNWPWSTILLFLLVNLLGRNFCYSLKSRFPKLEIPITSEKQNCRTWSIYLYRARNFLEMFKNNKVNLENSKIVLLDKLTKRYVHCAHTIYRSWHIGRGHKSHPEGQIVDQKTLGKKVKHTCLRSSFFIVAIVNCTEWPFII